MHLSNTQHCSFEGSQSWPFKNFLWCKCFQLHIWDILRSLDIVRC